MLAVAVLLLAFLGSSAAQSPPATWIPTDLNQALISNLIKANATEPRNQIAAFSTLGIIPTSVVGGWLDELINNPSFREGTVRWMPGVASKCAYNRAGCTKSVRITVIEYNYVFPNASDCRAYALVEADAILPEQASLIDGLELRAPVGPIMYEILAAPNSTNTSCTYVVQYPAPTQTLANILCNNGSCLNFACQPCNANQSIAAGGRDIETNCLPTSGVSTGLVNAIQGAAQCLAGGPTGRFQCRISADFSGCSQMACFPGDARVATESGVMRRMKDLRVGDRVRVAQPDGSLAWDDVYFFGHRDDQSMGAFVKLSLASRHGRRSRSIELSGKHFIPSGEISGAWSQRTNKRAEDVRVGDFVWVEAGDGLEAYQVASKETVLRQGLWAPYTTSGTIVVEGVAASTHSDWYLDGILDYFGRPDLLPAVYQALLGPLRLLYRAIGADSMRALDARFDFSQAVLSPLEPLKSLPYGLSAAVAISLAARFGAKLMSHPK